MRINLTEQNEEKIEAKIAERMGRARSFVHTFHDASAACAEAEHRLGMISLPKNARRGCVLVHKLAGPSAKSYRYSAVASQLRFIRGPKSWFLVAIERSKFYPREPERVSLTLTDVQINAGFSRLIDTLGIKEIAT